MRALYGFWALCLWLPVWAADGGQLYTPPPAGGGKLFFILELVLLVVIGGGIVAALVLAGRGKRKGDSPGTHGEN